MGGTREYRERRAARRWAAEAAAIRAQVLAEYGWTEGEEPGGGIPAGYVEEPDGMGGTFTHLDTQTFDDIDDAEAYFGVIDIYDDEQVEGGNYETWYNQLTDHEKARIYAYTGSDYSTINTALISGNLDHAEQRVQNYVKDIDSGLSKGVLDDPTTFFRGMGMSAFGGAHQTLDQMRQNLLGQEIELAGYNSASPDKVMAWSRDVRLDIHCPAGKGYGAYVAPMSAHKSEREFLFKRNLKIKINNIRRADPARDDNEVNFKYIFDVDVIPD